MSFTIPMLADADAHADEPGLLVLEDGTTLAARRSALAVPCSGRRCSPPG